MTILSDTLQGFDTDQNLMFQNAMNQQYEPDRLKFANQYADQQARQAAILTQYYPQQLALANQLTGQQIRQLQQYNQYYPQVTQASIDSTKAGTAKTQAETQYMPLEEAIKAQNAVRMGSRFGGAYQLAKSLNEMDPSVRAAWIANNQDAYNQMLTQLGNQGNQNADVLNAVVNKTFGGIAGPMPTASASPSPIPTNPGYAPPPSAASMPMGGIAGPIASPNVTSAGYMPSGMGALNPNSPTAMVNSAMTPPQGLAATPQSIANQISTPMGQTQLFQPMTDDQNQKIQWASQLAANRKAVTASMNNRVDNAVAMELWLNQNKDRYARAMASASRYSGLLGQGALGLQQLAQTDPQAYDDYTWMTTNFMPNLSNQVKLMEKMAGTDDQRDELHKLTGAQMNWTQNPQAAVNSMNNAIGTVQSISDSVMQAAEPNFKGVYRKMYGIPHISGPYIQLANPQNQNILAGVQPTSGGAATTSPLMNGNASAPMNNAQSEPVGTVKMAAPPGSPAPYYNIRADKVNEALKRGFKKVGS